ncbi:MAG: hypothetical protein KKD11_05780 [Candidatus Omnitrophica bacterium]|nr:hypothetical protein [Candidatus Omnitrophota bacterium]
MAKAYIFIVGFLCAWVLFSKIAVGQSSMPSNVTFSGESNVIYFLDRDTATLYRYNTQGKLTRSYVIKELGKDLQSR